MKSLLLIKKIYPRLKYISVSMPCDKVSSSNWGRRLVRDSLHYDVFVFQIEGTFQIKAPPILLGYTGEEDGEGDVKTTSEGKTYMSMFITMEPPVSPPEPMKEKVGQNHDWLIDFCLASNEQYFSYIQDKNKFSNI
jgi:hypothetical protein